MKMMMTVITAVMSLIAFGMMGIDKHRAKAGKWRIRERMLFIVALCLGAIGGTAGMQVFHHKTKHWYFKVFFPLLAVLQTVLVIWVWVK